MSAYNTPRLHSLTRVTLSITNQLAVTMTFCLPIKLATCFINAIAYHCLHSLSTLSPGPKLPLSLTKNKLCTFSFFGYSSTGKHHSVYIITFIMKRIIHMSRIVDFARVRVYEYLIESIGIRSKHIIYHS